MLRGILGLQNAGYDSQLASIAPLGIERIMNRSSCLAYFPKWIPATSNIPKTAEWMSSVHPSFRTSREFRFVTNQAAPRIAIGKKAKATNAERKW
jgi:hypothetical protein